MKFLCDGYLRWVKRKGWAPRAARLFLFAVSLAVSPQSLAQTQPGWQDTIETDRPNMANSAEALRPGTFQWESGVNLVSDSAVGTSAFSLPLNLRFGVVEQLELQFNTQGPLWTNPGAAGETWSNLQNLGAGAKWTLYHREGKPLESVGLLGGLSFQDRGSGPFLSQWNLTLAFNFNLPSDTSLGVNLGTNQDPAHENQNSKTCAGSFGFPLERHLSGYLEGSGMLPVQGDGTFGVDGGLLYLLTPDVQVDGALGRFWTGADAQTTVSIGFSFRVGATPKSDAQAEGTSRNLGTAR